jgi:MFS family permease
MSPNGYHRHPVTDQPPATPAPSYRALLAVPNLSRVLVAMMIARLAQTILGFAIVLFALTEYGDPGVAGLATFASIFPGILASPIAGALLDRHGRIRLVVLDYLVTVVALGLVGGLALAGRLPPLLLIAIVAVSSLTGILSVTGVRSLFPLIVPKPLWERVNAVDSTGYVVATILGPPIAAGLVAVLGGPLAMIAIAAAFLVAAVSMIGILDPPSDTESSGKILTDAWLGLQYTWRNPTLRGLGFSISLLNIAGGMTTIVIPIIVLQRLQLGEPVVGALFALSGVAGMISVFLFGRVDSRGREWNMLVIPMLGVAPATALLFGAVGAPTALALALIGASQAIFGLLNGPLDVALFTIRQRRTDPAWMGRAFAVSMAFNFAGYPIGAALTGIIAGYSLEVAIVMGVIACVVAAVAAARIIPRRHTGTSPAGA